MRMNYTQQCLFTGKIPGSPKKQVILERRKKKHQQKTGIFLSTIEEGKSHRRIKSKHFSCQPESAEPDLNQGPNTISNFLLAVFLGLCQKELCIQHTHKDTHMQTQTKIAVGKNVSCPYWPTVAINTVLKRIKKT